MDAVHRGWPRSRLSWLAAVGIILFLSVSSLLAQSTPGLSIVAPADGATVDGPVVIHIQRSGFVFDGVKIGQAPEPGVGHWHANVDGQYAGLSVTNVIEIPNEAFPTISAGEHTITVDLHENNHAATDPPVMQSIKLNFSKEVSLGAPTSLPEVGATTPPAAHLVLLAAVCIGLGSLLLYRRGLWAR